MIAPRDFAVDLWKKYKKLCRKKLHNKTSKSDNWFVKNTIDKISLNFSFIDRYKSTSTIEKEIAQDITLGSKYSYNFSDRNFLQPFKSFQFLPIIGEQISEARELGFQPIKVMQTWYPPLKLPKEEENNFLITI